MTGVVVRSKSIPCCSSFITGRPPSICVAIVVIEEETRATLEWLGLAACSFTTMDGINYFMSDINFAPLITEELKTKLLNATIWS